MSNTTENRLFSFFLFLFFYLVLYQIVDNGAVGGDGTVICQMPKYLSEFSTLTGIKTLENRKIKDVK